MKGNSIQTFQFLAPGSCPALLHTASGMSQHTVFLSQSKEMEDRKPVTPLEQAGMQSFSFPLSLFHLSSFICHLLKACVSKSSCCCLRALHWTPQQDFWFLKMPISGPSENISSTGNNYHTPSWSAAHAFPHSFMGT